MQMRAILLAGAMLVGAAAVAQAQVQYQYPPPPPPAAHQVPPAAAPASWSYDPYTSGLGPCVQANWGNSPPCKDFMQPTYGQPSYWAR